MHYVATDPGRVPNAGEMDFEFVTPDGNHEKMILQIAEVSKASDSLPTWWTVVIA